MSSADGERRDAGSKGGKNMELYSTSNELDPAVRLLGGARLLLGTGGWNCGAPMSAGGWNVGSCVSKNEVETDCTAKGAASSADVSAAACRGDCARIVNDAKSSSESRRARTDVGEGAPGGCSRRSCPGEWDGTATCGRACGLNTSCTHDSFLCASASAAGMEVCAPLPAGAGGCASHANSRKPLPPPRLAASTRAVLSMTTDGTLLVVVVRAPCVRWEPAPDAIRDFWLCCRRCGEAGLKCWLRPKSGCLADVNSEEHCKSEAVDGERGEPTRSCPTRPSVELRGENLPCEVPHGELSSDC
mmetsp:Transcript_22615/g.56742  ORF Transcript_22615/g.56742 Transcript_22615/m.56742 type:complete len:302 (-) Transcript_22615:731-1636(-)